MPREVNPDHVARFTKPNEPIMPQKVSLDAMDRWIEKRIERDRRLACPDFLQERAIENGEKSGITVVFLYTNEWQVHMTTSRGTVRSAPMIHEQTCMDGCQGSGIRPHILDGGGSPCDRCAGASVTLEQAWRNSLAELGLMSE